jgi:uncharacterized SAM-binding protein YcdF (DUF218 family)
VKALLLPPGCIILALIVAALACKRAPRSARITLWSAIAALYLASTPFLSSRALDALALPPAATASANPAAIVVLGGDVRDTAPAVVGPLTLERLRRAAALHRSTGQPLLVTGGRVPPSDAPVAELMAEALQSDFGVPVRWRETLSRNTWQNAVQSSALLRSEGIDSVYLVTQPWHLRRARYSFHAQGVDIVPVPASPPSTRRVQPSGLLPSAAALHGTYYALHEALGLIWYISWYGHGRDAST